MIKNRFKKIVSVIAGIAPLAVATVPHFAFATDIWARFTNDTIWSVLATCSQLVFTLTSGLLTIAGTLLNATLIATLNIATIVNSTPAIGTAWTTVRDFGSVFIIFMLLYAAIKIILGVGSGVGELIRNIVIVGLLINFSLFFTKLAIDASNIVSLSFYCAIAPSGLSSQCGGGSVASSGTVSGGVAGFFSGSWTDGGLSNVFMQSLDLQAFVNANQVSQSNANYNIFIATTGGTVLVFFAALSFFAAAAAFAIRIAVLIILMAFSPVFFIGMIFPDVKEYAEKWRKALVSMCLFMPVYLFLMYVALSVLSDPGFFAFAKLAPNPTNITGNTLGIQIISPNTISAILQYVIAFFLINAPLAAAISIAGEGSSFVEKVMKNARGFAGQHTAGRLARNIQDSKIMGQLTKNFPTTGLLLNSQLKKVSSATFDGSKGGFDDRLKKHTESLSKLADKAKPSESTSFRYTEKILDETEKKRAAKEIELSNLEKEFERNHSMSAEELVEKQNKIKEEIAAINKEFDTKHNPQSDKEKEVREKELNKIAKEEYAENVGKGLNIFTRKARKDAAKKVREDAKKSDKKITDEIKELLKGEGEDEEKPKEEGADNKGDGEKGGPKK